MNIFSLAKLSHDLGTFFTLRSDTFFTLWILLALMALPSDLLFVYTSLVYTDANVRSCVAAIPTTLMSDRIYHQISISSSRQLAALVQRTAKVT